MATAFQYREAALAGPNLIAARFAKEVIRDPHVARFFFHLHDCGTFIEDPEGREFLSLDDALIQARSDARDLLAAEVAEGKLCLGCRIEVVEEGTGRATIVPFATAVQLESAVAEKPPAI